MRLKHLYKFLVIAYPLTCSLVSSAQQVYEIPISKPGAIGKLIAKMDDISIKVSGYDQQVAKITVTKNGKRDDEAGILFDFFENNNIITVIRKPGPRAKGILLTIQVPRNFSVDLKTYWKESIAVSDINGEVKSKAYYGSISTNNTSGNLDLSSYFGDIKAIGISGAVVADNANGSIELSFSNLFQSIPMAFSNVNAPITLSLPVDSKASLTIGTYSGKIKSDFALDPSNTAQTSDKSKSDNQNVHRTINGGGVDLKIKTYIGNIIIKKK